MTVDFDRRSALRLMALAGAGAAAPLPVAAKPARLSEHRLSPLLSDIQRRAFNFFWERTDHATGLCLDRWPTPSFASITAIGHGLTAYPLGVEQGWISRADARARTLNTLRFLARLPTGPQAEGVAGYKGFFYHFLSTETGLRYGKTELSTVDSAMLFMGMLFAAQWFDRNNADEREIRALATDLVERAEWDWIARADGGIPMGWHPEHGFIDRIWDGYNEGKLVYILALGARRHPVRSDAWNVWTASYPRFWRGSGATRHLGFGPLFGHQFSELWIDFRGIFDKPMRAAGFDYFENTRRATWAQRAYAEVNPMQFDLYGKDFWGLSACDGPGDYQVMRGGRPVHFYGYAARGPIGEPDELDDGTLCPPAVVTAVPFAPEIAIPAVRALAARKDPRLYGRYGFMDGYNPSFRDTALKPETGTVDAKLGWVGGDWLGLDQGAVHCALANYRNEGVWRVMRNCPTIVRGLKTAGFTGGWIDHA
ncbi:MAG: glucoamylase family protein [Novosphingobium sp.]